MAINYHPRPGQILMASFEKGFKPPEMDKRRPIVVLSPPMTGRPGLVTVVSLSSTPPDPIMPYHMTLPKAALPQVGLFQKKETWVKGDMVYALGFHRLDQIQLGKKDPQTGKRVYFNRRLGRDRMREIYTCVLESLNLGHLAQYL